MNLDAIMALQKAQEHEEDMQRLRGFRPIDDTFMRCLFRNNLPLAELALRIITGIDDLKLIEEQTQKDLKRLVGARSLCLDVYGIDASGKRYDFEVQRADAGARPERARYHSSAMDIEALDAGQELEELPETYTIFVTEHDFYGYGDGVYVFDRKMLSHDVAFGDRQHILYVNGAYRGDDPLGDLMHDFCCNNADEMRIELMADGTRYWKENPEGVAEMCKVMEDLRDESLKKGFALGREEGREEGRVEALLFAVRNVLKSQKFTVDEAMDIVGIPENKREQYQEMLQEVCGDDHQ